MNVLILYASLYGNTRELALEMAKTLESGHKVKVVLAKDAKFADLENIELLVVGSPTHGGQAHKELKDFLDNIPHGSLKQLKAAAFDTRLMAEDLNFALKILVKTIGYAAPKIGDALRSKGGNLVVSPEGFAVATKEGPLKAGELERARDWIRKIMK